MIESGETDLCWIKRATANGVLYKLLRCKLTNSAQLIRFSVGRKSGVQPATVDPGAPLLPPGGVTPPGPAKYGTLAWR